MGCNEGNAEAKGREHDARDAAGGREQREGNERGRRETVVALGKAGREGAGAGRKGTHAPCKEEDDDEGDAAHSDDLLPVSAGSGQGTVSCLRGCVCVCGGGGGGGGGTRGQGDGRRRTHVRARSLYVIGAVRMTNT